MPFADLQFIKTLLKTFNDKYSELSIDLISDIIEETLIGAPNLFFTRELIQNNQDLCLKCGFCCRELECDKFNGKCCEDYDNRSNVCRDYPFYEIGFETGISLDVQCNFSIKLSEMVIDKRIKPYVDFDSYEI